MNLCCVFVFYTIDMLSSVFLGDEDARTACGLQFLPMERTTWSMLSRRGLFSPVHRHDMPSIASVPSPSSTHRAIGDHPLMHQLTNGISSRDVIKAILLLLFPMSFSESAQHTSPRPSKGHTTQSNRSPNVSPVRVRSASRPRPPSALGSNTRHQRRMRPSVIHRTAIEASSLDTSKITDTTMSIEEVVPLALDGILELEAPQLLCYLLLPLSHQTRCVDGADDFDYISTSDAMKMFRAARSLCRWTRWAVLAKGTCNGTIAGVAYFRSTIVPSINQPLMLSLATQQRIERFMVLRDIHMAAIVGLVHMLQVFLADAFELAFTKASLRKLQQTSPSPNFIDILDIWRFEDGIEHMRRVVSAFPHPEILNRAGASDVIAIAELELPTAAHVANLQRQIEALPRRTVGAVAHTLLHAAVPLGSISNEHRLTREKISREQIRELTLHERAAKLGLPPSLRRFSSSDLSSIPTGDHHIATSPTPPHVFHRLTQAYRTDDVQPTLENVLVQQYLKSPPTEEAAHMLTNAQVSHGLLIKQQVASWAHERRYLGDLRPLASKNNNNAFGHSAAQRLQDEKVHEYSRHLRALQRSYRKQTTHVLNLELNLPTQDAPCTSVEDLHTHVDEDCATLPSTAAAIRLRTTLNLGSELNTLLPPPLVTLSRLQVFECFFSGPEGLPPVR